VDLMMEWALSQPWCAASNLGTAERVDPWDSLADRQLVTLVLNGRPDAYGELVRRHQTAVYNIAYRLAGERQEALDLAQEAFVRAFSALESFDLERPFGPWIGRIATNLTLNWLQRRRVHTVPLTTEARDDQTEARRVPDYSAEPERVYLAGEQQAQLRQAILSLPPHYRAVIELRHFQDRSYEEIAEMLRLPLSDVKSHLFRARRLLRTWLEEHLSTTQS
jgi:RNA polymerase sigma-70 factor, ECF subfamily